MIRHRSILPLGKGLGGRVPSQTPPIPYYGARYVAEPSAARIAHAPPPAWKRLITVGCRSTTGYASTVTDPACRDTRAGPHSAAGRPGLPAPLAAGSRYHRRGRR